MKPENPHKNLKISFDQNILKNLDDYLLLISTWSKKMNLISNTDNKEIYAKHFIPSFWMSEIIRKENPHTLLDIGTGAGFPGMVLKILNPGWDVWLVESNRKKTLFLKEVAERLDENPKIINERVEKIKSEIPRLFDVIVSRAVTSLKQILNWSNGLLSDTGSVYVLKGVDYKNEPDYKMISGYKFYEINPGEKWIDSSPGLKSKLILKMKKV